MNLRAMQMAIHSTLAYLAVAGPTTATFVRKEQPDRKCLECSADLSPSQAFCSAACCRSFKSKKRRANSVAAIQQ
jgi:predicted nucleic acid-binding Zn ribbon protein